MNLRAVGRRAWLMGASWTVLAIGAGCAPPALAQAAPPPGPALAAPALLPGVVGQSLLVLADPWCPYNCQPDSDRPGYVVEMLREVFSPPTWRLSYRIVPWDRALQEVRDGQAAMALVVTRELAQQHGLLVGREPIGEAADCLYVAASNPLRFSQASDLDALRQVAVVSGYTYEHAFGAWLSRPGNRSKIVFTRGAHPAEVNARNLARGRVDGVIESAAVMQMQLQQLQLKEHIREAGCQRPSPMYVGFSPRLPQAAQLVEQFDQGIIEMRRNRRLVRILARYGVLDATLEELGD